MDKLGGFISIFSSPTNDTSYQGTSAEIEPLESNFLDEDLEDEDFGLENQQQQQSEQKSFIFSPPSLGMPSMAKNPSSMMPSLGSIRSSNFFGLRSGQQQQEVNEETMSSPPVGSTGVVNDDTKTLDQDIEAQNAANENSAAAAAPAAISTATDEQPPSSTRPKLHWKSFAGLARAKLQFMRPLHSVDTSKSNEQEEIPLAEDSTISGQSDLELEDGTSRLSQKYQKYLRVSENEPEPLELPTVSRRCAIPPSFLEENGGQTGEHTVATGGKETENLISKFSDQNFLPPTQTTGKGPEECWEVVEGNKGRLELFTMDGGGTCFVCKARLSYDPIVECADELLSSVDELAFKTGDVVLVWLPLDEVELSKSDENRQLKGLNGFFQAELLTGKKGLVHSDMIPQIAGKSTE